MRSGGPYSARSRVPFWVGLVLSVFVVCDSRAGAPSNSTLILSGSQSLAPVIELWAGDFAREFPGTTLHVQSSGSEAAPAALADGAADLAAMSRVMTAAEIQAFEARKGFRPTPIRVALDGVMVIVNALNPIRGLSMAQVDGIFSTSRRCRGSQDIATWGQVVPPGVWLSRPIQLIGAGLMSGTRRYFREQALCGGEFKSGVAAKMGPGEVVGAVRDSANAIGYVAMAFLSEGVRAVPLASGASGRFVEPAANNVLSGAYPLTRYFYLYMAKPAGRPLSLPVARFMTLALSPQGQKRVAEAGYIPLPAAVSSEEMAKLH